MIRNLIFFIALFSSIFADSNSSITAISDEANKQILQYTQKINEIQNKKLNNNEWIKTYSSYIQQKSLIDKKSSIKKDIKRLKSLKSLTKKQVVKLEQLKDDLKTVEDKIKLVENIEDNPFKKLIESPKINDIPEVTNPISLIGAYSFIKEIDSDKLKYDQKYQALLETIENLRKTKVFLTQINYLENGANSINKQHLNDTKSVIDQLLKIKDIYKTTKDIYEKKEEEIKIRIKKDISVEIKKITNIAMISLILLIFFLIFKLITKKYLAQKDSFYVVNKTLNIIFISILILIILFEYLANVTYLITILGFASAGIAIAMKDWFMSLMGWFTIVLGGTIHVGDRIKVIKNGVEYVGDVIDISLLRITLHEDITLTTYTTNRRAGRVIFIPNNYIFTDMIANYTHSGLKTVWDGIDFYVTFDSDVNKAMSIAKAIAKQYSKGYTDITRKQLNKLRSKYQLKNSNVEPRVYSFIEGYGMKVSIWYLTNSYATLTLRTTISNKILDEILESEDIKIAYPTQNIYHEGKIDKPNFDKEISSES